VLQCFVLFWQPAISAAALWSCAVAGVFLQMSRCVVGTRCVFCFILERESASEALCIRNPVLRVNPRVVNT
jgi:hypothetical protein